MLYESASRASAVLALNIEDLPNKHAKITAKGGDTMWITWGTDTAHLLPRLIAGRTSGPLFLSEYRPGPHRRATTDLRDICPETGRARLGYDRARVLLGPPRRRATTAPTPPLLSHPLRRRQRLRQRHDGQNRTQVPAVSSALRQTRPRRRPPGHRGTVQSPPKGLTSYNAATLRLAVALGQAGLIGRPASHVHTGLP
jgi:hypothetical protein